MKTPPCSSAAAGLSCHQQAASLRVSRSEEEEEEEQDAAAVARAPGRPRAEPMRRPRVEKLAGVY